MSNKFMQHFKWFKASQLIPVLRGGISIFVYQNWILRFGQKNKACWPPSSATCRPPFHLFMPLCLSVASSRADMFSSEQYLRAVRIAVIHRFANSPYFRDIFSSPDTSACQNRSLLHDLSLIAGFPQLLPIS